MPRAAPNKKQVVERAAPTVVIPHTAEAIAEPAAEQSLAPPAGPSLPGKPSLVEATQMLIARNGRFDFTAGGRPALPKLSALVGWEVTTRERDEAWEQVMERRALN